MSETTDETFYKRILVILLILWELLLGIIEAGAIATKAWGFLTVCLLAAVAIALAYTAALAEIGSE